MNQKKFIDFETEYDQQSMLNSNEINDDIIQALFNNDRIKFD